MQRLVDSVNSGEYLDCRDYKGATLHQLAKKASKHLNKYPFDVVYIIGGACDITNKEKETNRISFDWPLPNSLSDFMLGALSHKDKYFTKNHAASRVIFCPLVGVELSRVVNGHEVTEEQQLAVDKAVFEFNEQVFAINKRRSTFSPPLHRTIHRSSGKVKKSHYHHLEDGIHLNEEQKEKWADLLVKATARN